MAEILHILNGDSTRMALEAAGLDGDRCVWPDVLSDGPTVEEVGSEAYWDTRKKYMSAESPASRFGVIATLMIVLP